MSATERISDRHVLLAISAGLITILLVIVIGIYLTSIPRIPAGGTFYVGNEPATIGNDQRAVSIVRCIAHSASGIQPVHSSSWCM